MKQAIIIDIDNTLVDSEIPELLQQYSGLTYGTDEYWQKFYDNLHLCTKNFWCYKLIEQMSLDTSLTVLFITARSEKVKKQTEKLFLFSHNVKYELYMRKDDDLNSDEIVKQQILEEVLKKYNIIFAIDDHEKNCNMFKAYGIPTLKVW